MKLNTKDDLLRGPFLCIVRLHVLHHPVHGEVYGAKMIGELARHSYSFGPGTMYALLHSIDKFAFFVSEKRLVDGKVRGGRSPWITFSPSE